MTQKFDVIIIGAGASGLMCAAAAGQRGRKVLILDHGKKPGVKILMAGGGRCNFTNLNISADNYICTNPHFVKSALSRFKNTDFIEMVETYKIVYQQRSHGQLFCSHSASQILEMLESECRKSNVRLSLNTTVLEIKKNTHLPLKSPSPFIVHTTRQKIETLSLVIATGGVSIPAAGATPFGYKIAEQFKIPVIPPRPGLVPFTLGPEDKKRFKALSGISITAKISCRKASFQEQLLFTHRGLSGPAVLQISSYWQPGETLFIDLLPDMDLIDLLKSQKRSYPKKRIRSILCEHLPKRLVDILFSNIPNAGLPLGEISNRQLEKTAELFKAWQIKPGGTEGYRTAEVTVGGVDCNAVSSKTMEALNVEGLYFIGEVLDVTGHLGGYNLQWAWSSGFCAGQHV